jgi:hypothetical protein
MSPRRDKPVGHEGFQKQRDAIYAAVERSWDPGAPVKLVAKAVEEIATTAVANAAPKIAEEAVANARSEAGKKGGEARRENRLTAPHEAEALKLLIKARKLNPKNSTYNIGKDLAKKFGASEKTWERFITRVEDEGLVPKQIQTRAVRVR